MNSYSMRLAWAGMMIGILALSATALARSRPPARQEPTELTVPWQGADTPADQAGQGTALTGRQDGLTTQEAGPAGQPDSQMGQGAGPAGQQDGQAGWQSQAGAEAPGSAAEAAQAGAFSPWGAVVPTVEAYYVALRTETAADRVFLCDDAGCPLEAVEPDREGDATLGPILPGAYRLMRGQTLLGCFTLAENASLPQAEGLVWTDGELLHLEDFVAGSVELTLSLARPGYYALVLEDPEGQQWVREVYVPRQAIPDWGRHYLRTLEFRGLKEGPYALVFRGKTVQEIEVAAGEVTAAELTVDN